MKKKFLTVLALLAVLSTSRVFALGIGAQAGFPPGGSLTFKVDSLPCVFAADVYSKNNGLHLGLTADWWIANPKIEGTWGYFYGVGVGGGVTLGEPFEFAIGPRVVIGTNVFLFDKFLELYLQAAYQPMFCFGTGFHPDWWGFGGAGGFRVWF